MSLGQPEQTKRKRTKNPKTKMKNKHKKTDCKLSKINNNKKRKKKKGLEILVFFRGREDKSFCKGNTTEPMCSLSTRIRKHW